jgi:hypothetical protein
MRGVIATVVPHKSRPDFGPVSLYGASVPVARCRLPEALARLAAVRLRVNNATRPILGNTTPAIGRWLYRSLRHRNLFDLGEPPARRRVMIHYEDSALRRGHPAERAQARARDANVVLILPSVIDPHSIHSEELEVARGRALIRDCDDHRRRALPWTTMVAAIFAISSLARLGLDGQSECPMSIAEQRAEL